MLNELKNEMKREVNFSGRGYEALEIEDKKERKVIRHEQLEDVRIITIVKEDALGVVKYNINNQKEAEFIIRGE